METNNRFSTHRFLLLFRQSLIIYKKNIGISLIGAAGTLFVVLLILQRMNNFQNWTNRAYMNFFLFCFVSVGGIFTSQSFPAFRSKEKSLGYLLLPASASEKFAFEFLTRIASLIIFMPLLYWVVANIEGAIVNHYVPRFINHEFSFNQGMETFKSNFKSTGLNLFAVIQMILFVYVVTFTGACHFSKSPRVKTLFTLSVIIGGYALFIYLLSRILNIKNYVPGSDLKLFPNNNNELMVLFAVAATIVNLVLLAIAWFRFKEKEV